MGRESRLAASRNAGVGVFGAALRSEAVRAAFTVWRTSAIDADAARTLRIGEALDALFTVADLVGWTRRRTRGAALLRHRIAGAAFAAVFVTATANAGGALGAIVGRIAERLVRRRLA